MQFETDRNFIVIFIVLTLLAVLCVFNSTSNLSALSVVLVSALVCGVVSIVSYVKGAELHKTALIIIILFGLMCVFLSPIGSVSDEVEHFTRSEITSEGILFPEYDNGFTTIASASHDIDRDHNIYETDWDSQKINYTKVKANSAFQQNPFYPYIAQAVGIDIAKLLDLNNIWMLWLARVCNLILYAGLCVFAIKKTPVLKMPMFVFACFPLSIIQAASCSCDGFIFSFTLVVISYLLYMYKAHDLGKRHILVYTVLVLILGLSKVTFGALALLIFIVPRKNFKNVNDYYLGILTVLVVLLTLISWSRFHAVSAISHSWRSTYFKSSNVNATSQLNYILSSPQSAVTFAQIANQLTPQVDALTRFYSEYPTFPLLNYIYFIFLTLFTLFYPIYEKITLERRILTGFTLAIIVFGTYFVQYLTWAPVGSTSLLDAGVVPRYFLASLVLLPLVFNLSNREFKNQELIVITSVCLFLSGAMLFIASVAY